MDETTDLLRRIAEALERQSPPPQAPIDLYSADGFLWSAAEDRLKPVQPIAHQPLDLLLGIERQKATLLDNTRRFAAGAAANNALLWGVRGMGKSALVKAVHSTVLAESQPSSARSRGPALIEIHREDITALPRLLDQLREQDRRCLLFCDDLSFDAGETSYKSLKAVLEGGIEGRPDNVLFYATSNRRHLMPREASENDPTAGLHPGETSQEKISLSDRFGLWIGFHACDQETFQAMVRGYARAFDLADDGEALLQEAHEWAMARGGRSGRVAWQFIQDLAGRQGKSVG